MFLSSFILVLKEALVTDLVILGISFLTWLILALKVVLTATLVILGFSWQHHFLLHHLVHLSQQEQVLIYKNFSNSKLILSWFLKFFFVTRSNNFLPIKINNKISPRDSVFNFFNLIFNFLKPLQTNLEYKLLQKYFYVLIFLQCHRF